MPTAATRTDVEDLVGEDLTASADRVDRLIERAEAIVAGDMPGFTFGAVVDDEVTIDPDGDDLLVLPYYPVTSVSAITIDGAALAADAFTFDTLGNVRRRIGGSILAPIFSGGRLEGQLIGTSRASALPTSPDTRCISRNLSTTVSRNVRVKKPFAESDSSTPRTC